MGDAPRSEQFDDVYFSADDGPGETAHVFLDGNNLPARWQDMGRFCIGETGFGTGLNFLLAWELFDRTAKPGAFLDFISVEKFPLSAGEIGRALSPWAERLSPFLEKLMARYPIRVPGFHRIVFDGRVALTLIFGDANDVLPEIVGGVDAWFLDGFTPAKNPDMWTDAVFGEMARLSRGGTTFSTFTAAGFVKRGLESAGFAVEKKKGFGRKRDMLSGVFKSSSCGPPAREGIQGGNIAVLGAGLAGTSCAWALAQYGFKPELYDPHGIAAGASGNPVGLINPRLSAFRSAESDFYTAAFAQAVRTLPMFKDIGYAPCGGLHLVTDAEKEKRFLQTVAHWGWHAAHMEYVSVQDACDMAGIMLNHPALALPDAGQVDPSRLCAAYAKGIRLTTRHTPGECDAIVHAGGAGLVGLFDLPLHTVRGQVTFAAATKESARLKTNLNYGGYISAPIDGRHAIGSTFQKWLTDTNIRHEDDVDNLAKLSGVAPGLGGFLTTGSRAGLRVSASDRFPIVGKILCDENSFISTAYGSHGIAGSLAGAHLIADFLRGGPFSLGQSTIKALSAERFAIRALRKNRNGHLRELCCPDAKG